jgi:hypothetical protein
MRSQLLLHRTTEDSIMLWHNMVINTEDYPSLGVKSVGAASI